MRTALTLARLDVHPSPRSTWAALRLTKALTARHWLTGTLRPRHPCREAASFLPCSSRPPDVCLLRFARPRRRYGPNSRRGGRAPSQTMDRRRQDDEAEITEAADTRDEDVGPATGASPATGGSYASRGAFRNVRSPAPSFGARSPAGTARAPQHARRGVEGWTQVLSRPPFHCKGLCCTC
jgi:hypothetical protein